MDRLEQLKEKVKKKQTKERVVKIRKKRWEKIEDSIAMIRLLNEAKKILGV